MVLAGATDTSGNLVVYAYATTETPADVMRTSGGDGDPLGDDNGLTDTSGNYLCKFYA